MTPTDHLDDETLSALLDGEAADDHLAACDRCQARLQALAAVADAVASPVEPANPARRQAHINAAVAAAHPRAPAASRWLGLAAALLLVAGAAGAIVVATTRHGPTKGASASLAGPEPAPPQRSLVDLGPQHDLATVARLLRQQLRAPQSNVAAGAIESGSGRAGSGAASSGVASGTASPPSNPAVTGPRTDAAAGANPCGGTAPAAQQLVASAFLSWDGTPALVFAYSPDGTTARMLVEIRALSGCSLLASQTIGSS